ncbi:mannose-1-phosphate guanyltransferase [Aureimonas sp. Leaf454]|uniref:mannose-1-phosphate guanylyltransferase/mannose-6-phosphate isomerase n=1 Tax=Aureimonas sp. Leaf454 TaxID=1736381 RepID=UPI0006F8A7A7|nr:mannose-1-phosphate guanylyltransferase/mannose-6-phosphate isomerase [Aureimonas sp. Leaf454]KQT50679.1 mannose-1-phosphate guanyltransferase [Aureimonas sp. Leaf454]
MPSTIRPLILCGGAGTRLWPMSRDSLPKQFIPLTGELSSFQETMLRVADRDVFGWPIVVTSEAYRFEAERQLRAIEMDATLLLEPEPRDSGPAILAACLLAAEDEPDACVAVLASDHAIRDRGAFVRSLQSGLEAAMAGRIVTFGIAPTHPATGYGYIEAVAGPAGDALPVRRFVEKPDAATAARYIEEGYLWNSGNFLTMAATLVEEYQRMRPGDAGAVRQAVSDRTQDRGAILIDRTPYRQAEKLSIDYAVMERTGLASVVRSAWGWSDVGTFDALWDVSDRDGDDNVLHGDIQTLASRGCFVRSTGQMTSVVGANDLVVIVEPDAVLVVDRHRSGEVKMLVEDMKRRSVPQASAHSRVHRPWGWYEVRDLGADFQVKRIAVYPGGRLSLQKHRYRAEHWVVVTGTARVTIDETIRILRPNEHAEIPLGAVHRLENTGSSLLEIVEVQHGSYLGEDDIIRIEDIYNRIVPVQEAAE